MDTVGKKRIDPCNKSKCGEYNILRCCREKGHTGEHCYVIDHENDYEWNKPKSCFNCKHYHSHKEIESWELPHIFWYEYSCDKRPTVANLKQFPFKKTMCKSFESNK